MRFWDTSALAALILRQAGKERLAALLAGDDQVALWWAAKVEAVSALCRLRRVGAMDDNALSEAFAAIDTWVSGAHEIEPTEEVRNVACRLLRVHELRAADALQLAAALVWAEHSPGGFGFVCLDGRLRQAAEREGFDVVPK